MKYYHREIIIRLFQETPSLKTSYIFLCLTGLSCLWQFPEKWEVSHGTKIKNHIFRSYHFDIPYGLFEYANTNISNYWIIYFGT